MTQTSFHGKKEEGQNFRITTANRSYCNLVILFQIFIYFFIIGRVQAGEGQRERGTEDLKQAVC